MLRPPFRDRLKIHFFIGLIIFILLYFGFRAFNYFSGPKIIVNSPLPYEVVKGETFILSGNVKNARNIYINGREISIDENGNFGEELVNKAPYSIVVIKAVDKYEKSKEIVLEVAKE